MRPPRISPDQVRERERWEREKEGERDGREREGEMGARGLVCT